MFRTIGLLFGLSLMLTACDVGDLLDLIGGGAPEPPAAEESEPVPDEVSDESEPDGDDVSDESEPDGDDVSDESEPEEEDDHEHQSCRNRDGGDDTEVPEPGADEADAEEV